MIQFFTAYAKKGLSAVRVLNYTHKRSPMEDHRELLQKHFAENPPASVKQARDDIERLTGIKKGSPAFVFSCINLEWIQGKWGAFHRRQTPNGRKNLKKSMEPVLGKAKDGKAVVYFVDAAHFVLGAFLAILWSFRGIFVETSSGRHRLNVLGALNAVTKEMITVINTWCAAEALAIGDGGVILVHQATQVSRSTIYEGIQDIRKKQRRKKSKGRIRRKGGGARSVLSRTPEIASALETLVEAATKGDPEIPMRWINKGPNLP